MRSSTLLLQLAAVASFVGVVAGTYPVECTMCASCCGKVKDGYNCVFDGSSHYNCVPSVTLGASNSTKTDSPGTGVTITCKECTTTPRQTIVATNSSQTTRTPGSGGSIRDNSTVTAIPTPLPKNTTAVATGSAGGGGGAGGGTPTVATGGAGTSKSDAPAATSSARAAPTSGSAGRKVGSVLTAAVIGSIVWFLG